VPQHAFVQSGSIRMTITFSDVSEETDENRMAQVIQACGLQQDLSGLGDGVE
jgi:ABC-type uncharacterized transport system fused permease/ATPase subunit